MAKRKTTHRTSNNSSTTKRTPPSVPKCVQRCPDGYCTNFIKLSSGKTLRFFFKKISNGYLIYSQSSEPDASRICMSADISIAPSTRKLFEDKTTLSEAIDAVETWLGIKLPDIR